MTRSIPNSQNVWHLFIVFLLLFFVLFCFVFVFSSDDICLHLKWHANNWPNHRRKLMLYLTLETGRGTGAETCELDDRFPPDDFVFILYVYIYIYIYILFYITNCVFLSDNSLIPGCLWLLVFVLNNTLILVIWCSTIPHLPGCFCPWTFFQNIGFNMVPSDPFMSHLVTQLWYSAGEFKAL